MRHRRVANAIVLAALQANNKCSFRGIGALAGDADRHFNLIEIHRDITEVFIVIRLGFRAFAGGRKLRGDAVSAF